MPFSFSASGSSNQQNSFSFGGNLSQLIEGQALTLGSSNSSGGASGKSKSAYSQSLRDVEEPNIIGDSSDYGNDSAVGFVISFGSVLGQDSGNSRDRDRESVQSGLVKSLVNDFVKFGFGSSSHETVKLGYDWTVP